MTINKDNIIEQLEYKIYDLDNIIAQLNDQNQNLTYENKRMGDFIEALGLAPDEITSYVINGGEQEVKMMIDYIIENNI